MDEKLYDFLRDLDFTEEDISELCSFTPGLEIISFERAEKNIKAVVSSGFPKEDIDGLIFSNPGFLCNDPDYLKEKLKTLGKNVEEALKNDPMQI